MITKYKNYSSGQIKPENSLPVQRTSSSAVSTNKTHYNPNNSLSSNRIRQPCNLNQQNKL